VAWLPELPSLHPGSGDPSHRQVRAQETRRQPTSRQGSLSPKAGSAPTGPSSDHRPTLKLERTAQAAQGEVPLRFGEWLVQRGVLTRAELLLALLDSALHDWRVGDAVVVLGLASRRRVEAEVECFERREGAARDRSRRRELERRVRQLELEREDRRRRGER